MVLATPELKTIRWEYDDDNDRWVVTAIGKGCDGIQTWYIDDNTGKVLP